MCPAGRTPRVALLLLILVIAHAGNALKCYSCSSETDLQCRDYFDRSYHMVKDCEIDRHGHTNMEPYCKKLVYAGSFRTAWIQNLGKESLQAALKEAGIFYKREDSIDVLRQLMWDLARRGGAASTTEVGDHHQHNETIRSCAWASREDSGSICRETLPSYSSHLLHCSICHTEACNGAPGSALASSIACFLPALVATVFKTA